jgi:hypothetical protein
MGVELSVPETPLSPKLPETPETPSPKLRNLVGVAKRRFSELAGARRDYSRSFAGVLLSLPCVCLSDHRTLLSPAGTAHIIKIFVDKAIWRGGPQPRNFPS